MNSYFIILTFCLAPSPCPHQKCSPVNLWAPRLSVNSPSSGRRHELCSAAPASVWQVLPLPGNWAAVHISSAHSHLCFHPFLGRVDNPLGEPPADVGAPPHLGGWPPLENSAIHRNPLWLCLSLWILADILCFPNWFSSKRPLPLYHFIVHSCFYRQFQGSGLAEAAVSWGNHAFFFVLLPFHRVSFCPLFSPSTALPYFLLCYPPWCIIFRSWVLK